jgi:hypothetical protein
MASDYRFAAFRGANSPRASAGKSAIGALVTDSCVRAFALEASVRPGGSRNPPNAVPPSIPVPGP